MIDQNLGYLLLGLCVLCSTLSQVFQKYAANTTLSSASILVTVFNRFTFLSFLCLGTSLVFWLAALSVIELHVAYSSLSLSYVLILVVSRYHFRESVPRQRWLGGLMIVAGTLMVVSGAKN